MHSSGNWQAERSVKQPNASTEETVIAYRLEVKGGMSWVRLELRKCPICEGLNICRQCLMALPESP